MSTVIPSQLTKIDFENKTQPAQKFIHPRVLKVTQSFHPKSPRLEIRDEFQPSKGDLRKKIFTY